VSFNRDLINTIAISEDDREQILATTFNENSGVTGPYGPTGIFSPDPIEGKGEGRILLLHGRPGLGKTYTAECAAEWSCRFIFAGPNMVLSNETQADLLSALLVQS
jgi:hypothetical protein